MLTHRLYKNIEFIPEVLNKELYMYYVAKRIGNSVEECSPVTQAAWVRFPADAFILEWN